MGAGGRRFKSSRPDQYKQWVTVYAVAHFLFGVADDDIIFFGGETNSEQGACTAILPDKKELKILFNGLT